MNTIWVPENYTFAIYLEKTLKEKFGLVKCTGSNSYSVDASKEELELFIKVYFGKFGEDKMSVGDDE